MTNKVSKKYFATFFVAYPYYFPHFIPICKELSEKGYKVLFVLSDKQNTKLMKQIAQENSLEYIFGEEKLFNINSKFIFFANPYKKAKDLKAKTVFLEHGIGTKSMSFYQVIEYIDIYLIEGEYKYNRLLQLYPQYKDKLKKVGFSKFDTIINLNKTEKKLLYQKYNLNINKKTILYAPTFFPSSIEKMGNDFPKDFKDNNILVKAHYLTYERKQYKKQREKLLHWSSFENCTVVDVQEYSLVPLFAISDILISDESSAMFEFAALNKPVISNRYFKLRLSYYFMPWKLKKRIDKEKDRYRKCFDNAYNYQETLHMTKDALTNPSKLESFRYEASKDICGDIDGKVSQRIVDVLCEALHDI